MAWPPDDLTFTTIRIQVSVQSAITNAGLSPAGPCIFGLSDDGNRDSAAADPRQEVRTSMGKIEDTPLICYSPSRKRNESPECPRPRVCMHAL